MTGTWTHMSSTPQLKLWKLKPHSAVPDTNIPQHKNKKKKNFFAFLGLRILIIIVIDSWKVLWRVNEGRNGQERPIPGLGEACSMSLEVSPRMPGSGQWYYLHFTVGTLWSHPGWERSAMISPCTQPFVLSGKASNNKNAREGSFVLGELCS